MRILLLFVFVLLFASCSVSKKLERSAREDVLSADVLKTAHVGISVYEPATGKTWYDYQGDHYFVPASNTKIPTCYAAMKYLGDSLVGLRYDQYTLTSSNNQVSHITLITGTGDPTFLHRDFPNQPVYNFLKKEPEVCYVNNGYVYQFKSWGSGWALNDFLEPYMPERSAMPVYGNTALFRINDDTLEIQPHYFYSSSIRYTNDGLRRGIGKGFLIKRTFGKNDFNTPYSNEMYRAKISFTNQIVPFTTVENEEALVVQLLSDTLHKTLTTCNLVDGYPPRKTKIHSQPTDSLLRPMMHRSDNFFAEQSLLMVSNELLGFMNDAKIIDTLLKTDFKDLPQKPRWVDGSGLSRYNLFSPQDFVFILNKMKNEFGMARVKNIFATGGEGTLSNYYVNDKDFIYAKTGTLSGVVAISGFLTTKKGAELIFSIQVNNHNGSATEVRRAVEKFVEGIREKY